MGKNIEIKWHRLLLAEGADAYFFFIWALEAYDVGDVQVMDYGGVSGLRPFLSALRGVDGFAAVETLAIVRDAETDPAAAVDALVESLQHVGLPSPPAPLEFSDGRPRVTYMVLPGYDVTIARPALVAGTLEDLCLATIEDDPDQDCVESFLSCLAERRPLKWPHKTRLHTYLTSKDRYVGAKLGEAADFGAWDWQHPALEPVRRMLTDM